MSLPRLSKLALLLLAALQTLSACRGSAPKHERPQPSSLQVQNPQPAADVAASVTPSSAQLSSQSSNSAPKPKSADTLNFILHTTGGKTDAEPLPWVIAMHGLGDRPESFVDLFDEVSFAAHVYVLQAPLPYGSGFDWFGVRVSGNPVRLSQAMERAATRVVQVIDELGQQPNNRGKPAVTGFSQGGMLSYTLAVLHPDKIGFAAPVSGWLPQQLWPKAKSAGPLATIVGFHGEADRGVPFDQCRLAVEHLVALGYPVTFHSYPGLGHSMSRALIAEWDSALASALSAER
jgi:phospholipase/carboxylesterase